MNRKQDAARQAAVNRSMRPASYALGVAAVVCVLATVVQRTAPDTFAATGGWLTVMGVLFVVAVWTGLAMVRRVTRVAAEADDQPLDR